MWGNNENSKLGIGSKKSFHQKPKLVKYFKDLNI